MHFDDLNHESFQQQFLEKHQGDLPPASFCVSSDRGCFTPEHSGGLSSCGDGSDGVLESLSLPSLPGEINQVEKC